jgi:EAL and modified HD-GYP domain-containing signal transduction protein
MHSMRNHPDSDPSEPCATPVAEKPGSLTLRLRPIGAGPALAPATQRAMPPAAEGRQTLTTFDWFDTIVDELVHASDGLGSVKESAQEVAAATDFVQASGDFDRSAVLGRVVLGYSPIIDRQQGVVATRLTVVPVRADNTTLDAGALLEAIAEVWPAGGGAVSLNVSSESLLNDVLRARPNINMMLEVPAFLAAEPANVDSLRELASRGNTLLLKGRALRELPRAVLPCFKWSIIDFTEDRRLVGEAPSGTTRTIPHIQTGVRTMAELRLSFERGAIAVVGWPLHEPITTHLEARPDLEVVLEMIGRIDRNQATAEVHRPLLRDPVLAYELLRHVCAAASRPVQVETGSLQQAVDLLGPQPLRRWLASVLQRTGDERSLRPVNFAALRRGLLMRMLWAGEAQTGGELFLCGVFSLLDRIFGRPIGELLGTLAIPERVVQALVERRGPFMPLLELVRAIESEVPHDIRSAANAAFVSPGEINRALLRTLFVAAELERGAR